MVEIQTRLNPFPGLRPFAAKENHLFFGREAQTDELLRRLRRTRFLAVVGTSGSGKSSLVRAGLLPALYSGFMTKAGSSWRVAMLRPGNNPIANLAEALNRPNVFGSDAEDAHIQTIITETILRRGALGLVEVVQQVRRLRNENLLIVVDQFEELFRFKQKPPKEDSGDEAAAFVKLLLEATQKPELPIYVVLTMRSDYLGDCAQFRDLPEAINDSQYLIPRLTRNQLRMVIEGPVAVGRAEITPRLVNRLLNDIGDNPDQLPILQHALMRTWDYWMANHEPGDPIDLRHYEAIGSMDRALSQHADEIYDQLLDARCQKIAEKLFKCLTEKDPNSPGIRHPTEVKEICAVAEAEEAEVIAIVEEFRAPGCSFLTPSVGVKLDGDSVLDISHESLMRVWERLKDWVNQEERSARIYRRLDESAELHEEEKVGLYRDPELGVALEWREQNQPNAAWAQRYNHEFEQDNREFERAMRFLDASAAARDAEIAQKERRQQEEIERQKKARRNITFALIAAIAGFVVASGLGLVAFIYYRNAQQNEIKALSKSSEALFSSGQGFDALMEALRAAKILQGAAWTIVDPQIQNQVVEPALRQAVYGVKERDRLEGHTDWVYSVSFSADGKTIATASSDHNVKLWSWDGKESKELTTLKGHTDRVYSVSFSPDGKKIATASGDNTVKLWSWDGKESKELTTLKGHTDRVYSVSFSPDGKMIATASEDGKVKLWSWDGKKSKELETLKGHNAGITSVSFSPDGKKIATASWDKTVKLWNLDGKEDKLLKILKGHNDGVHSVSFSPDGKTIATASWDNTVKLWSWDGKESKELTILKGHTDRVYSVSFSPDGKKIATASGDKTVKLWNLDGTMSTTLTGHKGRVYDVRLSPDGTIATASEDKTVRLWSRDNRLLLTLLGHTDDVHSISFSPDGKTIATSSKDKTFKLWSRDGTLLKTQLGHTDRVWSVRFSPDGKTIATASFDKTVKLWSWDGKKIKHLKTLEGHKKWVFSVSFSPDGKMIASAGEDKYIRIWSQDDNKWRRKDQDSKHTKNITDVRFSPDGKMIATASDDGTAKLWSWDGENIKYLKTLEGHTDEVNGVNFNLDSNIIATASDDKTVKLWSRDGTLLKTFKGSTQDEHKDRVMNVSFSPDGKTIATASFDKTVKLWNIKDGELLQTLPKHENWVWDVSFSPDGNTLASASSDKSVRLYNLDNTKLQLLELDELLLHGCNWVRNYLKNNPSVEKSDRHLCNGIGTQK